MTNAMKITNLNKVFNYGTRYNTLKSFTAKREEAIQMVRVHTESVVYDYCVNNLHMFPSSACQVSDRISFCSFGGLSAVIAVIVNGTVDAVINGFIKSYKEMKEVIDPMILNAMANSELSKN